MTPSIGRTRLKAVLGTLLLLVGSCKTTSNQASAIKESGLAVSKPFFACGPAKTFYFHWMTQRAAEAWEKLAGAKLFASNGLDLMTPRTGSWAPVNKALIDGILQRNDTAEAGGGGIYLAGTPTSSKGFGDVLLIFRMTGADGMGLPCTQDTGFKAVNTAAKTDAARSSLPLLVMYMPAIGDHWFVSPRTPDRGRGESSVFDLPHQGDADQVADEMMQGKSRSEMLMTLDQAVKSISSYSVKVGKLTLEDWLKNYCVRDISDASETFVQQWLCQSLPSRLEKAMPQLQRGPLTSDELKAVDAVASIYKQKNGRVMLKLLDRMATPSN